MKEKLEFELLTGKFVLNYDKCHGCDGFYCVKACSLYGRNVLRIKGGKPVIFVSPEEAGKLCIECLACEVECILKGKGAIRIDLSIPGLKEYKERLSLSGYTFR